MTFAAFARLAILFVRARGTGNLFAAEPDAGAPTGREGLVPEDQANRHSQDTNAHDHQNGN